MRKRYVVLTVLLTLACGAGFGYFLKSTSPVPANESDFTKVKVLRATDTSAAEVAALKRRIRELEKALAEKENKVTSEPAEIAMPKQDAEQKPPQPPNRRMGDFRNFFKDMAKNDPARFTQMTNRMARWQQRRQTETQNRLDMLGSIDTAGMSEAEKATHENLQDALLRREELHQTMQELRKAQVDSKTDEESESLGQQMREVGKEMHDLSREIHKMEKAERKTLLNQTMTALGYSGEDAQVITETIQSIYTATGEGGRGGGHRGPPPPR